MTRISRAVIQKSSITFEEYEYYLSIGVKRAFYQKELVKVIFNCSNCGKEHISTFSHMKNRNQKYLTLCTKCAGSINRREMNFLRDDDYYKNEEYRNKISEGVKAHYKLGGKVVIKQRIEKRWERFLQNGVPDFLSKKIIVNGISCDSYGEGAYVEWKMSENYKVEKCNFFIPYLDKEQKERHYIPDFLIGKDRIITLIELKCDYIKNFKEKSESVHKVVRVNFSTYNWDELMLKVEAAKKYCINKGWNFELITLDDKDFNYIYNKAKRIRSENKRKKYLPL